MPILTNIQAFTYLEPRSRHRKDVSLAVAAPNLLTRTCYHSFKRERLFVTVCLSDDVLCSGVRRYGTQPNALRCQTCLLSVGCRSHAYKYTKLAHLHNALVVGHDCSQGNVALRIVTQGLVADRVKPRNCRHLRCELHG